MIDADQNCCSFAARGSTWSLSHFCFLSGHVPWVVSMASSITPAASSASPVKMYAFNPGEAL